MAPKKMPPREYVRECLDYAPDTGVFHWRVRPLAHFFDEAARKKCNRRHAGRVAGAPRANGYTQIKIYGSFYLAHRLAWFMINGEPMPDEIDHINGDRSDTRIANLRAATSSQNNFNRHDGKLPISGVRGIFQNRWGIYEARIRLHGVHYHIGSFATLEEAAEARRDAAERLFGEFARH
jgi:HNH endonuclease